MLHKLTLQAWLLWCVRFSSQKDQHRAYCLQEPVPRQIRNTPSLLHVKLNAACEKISGYYGAAISGYNSQVLEGVCNQMCTRESTGGPRQPSCSFERSRCYAWRLTGRCRTGSGEANAGIGFWSLRRFLGGHHWDAHISEKSPGSDLLGGSQRKGRAVSAILETVRQKNPLAHKAIQLLMTSVRLHVRRCILRVSMTMREGYV